MRRIYVLDETAGKTFGIPESFGTDIGKMRITSVFLTDSSGIAVFEKDILQSPDGKFFYVLAFYKYLGKLRVSLAEVSCTEKNGETIYEKKGHPQDASVSMVKKLTIVERFYKR